MNRSSSCARVAGALLLASFLLPASTAAQVVQSERATVSQTVDGTVITIDYGRPRVKGRGEPFGDIVHIGDHRWTAGADWASTITSNRPFELNGHRVPEGTWSMWIDLEEEGWTFILDPKDSIFHTAPPEDGDEQIRFALERRKGPLFIESMLFWIPETRISGFDLLLSWGRTEIPFEVRVEPTFRTEVAKAKGTPLLGTYEFRWVDPPDPEAGGRQTLPFDVSWSGNHLLAESIRTAGAHLALPNAALARRRTGRCSERRVDHRQEVRRILVGVGRPHVEQVAAWRLGRIGAGAAGHYEERSDREHQSWRLHRLLGEWGERRCSGRAGRVRAAYL